MHFKLLPSRIAYLPSFINEYTKIMLIQELMSHLFAVSKMGESKQPSLAQLTVGASMSKASMTKASMTKVSEMKEEQLRKPSVDKDVQEKFDVTQARPSQAVGDAGVTQTGAIGNTEHGKKKKKKTWKVSNAF